MWVAWYARRQRKCPHCGNDPADCGDADRPWYPQRTVCYSTMETRGASARYAALHEDRPWHDGSFKNWAKERSANFPYRYDDGVTIWVAAADLTPDDNFLSGRPASSLNAEHDGPGDHQGEPR